MKPYSAHQYLFPIADDKIVRQSVNWTECSEERFKMLDHVLILASLD